MSAQDELDEMKASYDNVRQEVADRAAQIDGLSTDTGYLALLAAMTENKLGIRFAAQTIETPGAGWQKLILRTANAEMAITPGESGGWVVRPFGSEFEQFEQAYTYAAGQLIGAELAKMEQRLREREREAKSGDGAKATWRNSTPPG